MVASNSLKAKSQIMVSRRVVTLKHETARFYAIHVETDSVSMSLSTIQYLPSLQGISHIRKQRARQ